MLTFLSRALVVTALLLAGCGPLRSGTTRHPGDIDRATDCSQVCTRHVECSAGEDTSVCAVRCRDRADANAEYAAKLDACEECMDDSTCEELANGACGGVCIDLFY
jgi:hypothetical protein